jgi:lipid A disaccharide synthetase
MTIYFLAGEVSADNHGAALMRSLRLLDPEMKFIGRSPARNSKTGLLAQRFSDYGKCCESTATFASNSVRR